MPHIALNMMRFIVGAGGFGIYFMIKRENPTILLENVKPVAIYCLLLTFTTLSTFIPVVYIPLTASDALYSCFVLSTSLLFVAIIDRRRIYWVEV